jgi:hypothetical protein
VVIGMEGVTCDRPPSPRPHLPPLLPNQGALGTAWPARTFSADRHCGLCALCCFCGGVGGGGDGTGPKGGDADSKLVVAGMAAGVEAACAVIEAVIAENFTVSVPVENPDVISYLVGTKGETIKKFQVWAGATRVLWLCRFTALCVLGLFLPQRSLPPAAAPPPLPSFSPAMLV